MSHLSLSFLGGFEARLAGETLTAFGSDKARALLVYLVIEAARPHRRAELGSLLWPDLPEKKAAHNLSQTLLRLRTALRESKTAAQPYLLLTNQDVQFNLLADYRLDVVQFSQLIQARGQHHHTDPETCPACMQWLHQAADLYRGDLLAGFFVRDSLGFEEWRLARQEVLHRQALETLTQLTAYHEGRGEYDRVQDYARRLIKLEPWSDQPHLQLMRAFNHAGQTAAALEQYETYRQVLDQELGLEPSAAATTLYEEIKTASRGASAIDIGKPDRYTRPSLHSLRSPGERRQVTVLMCGQSAMSTPRDPEELHEHMASCRQQCESIVSQYGGYRLRRQGDKCVILFGYPQALEDAPRRAVDASLAMTGSLSENAEVSIGIHTGVIVEGERRGSLREDPDIYGDAPNFARACQNLAEAGTVVITEDTQRLVRGLFDCKPLGSRHLAETAQTLAVYQVRGHNGAASRLEWLAQTRRLTTFIGRESELAQLLAAWQKAQRGEGRAVLIQRRFGSG